MSITTYTADPAAVRRYGLRQSQRNITVRWDDEPWNGRQTVDEIHATGVSLEMLDNSGLWMDVCGLRVEIRAYFYRGSNHPKLVVTAEPDDCTPDPARHAAGGAGGAGS
jgi:hypothetical protein